MIVYRKQYWYKRNKEIQKIWNDLVKKGKSAKEIIYIIHNKFLLSRRQIYNILKQKNV